MDSDRDKQNDRTPERAAGERVRELKQMTKDQLMEVHRKKHQGRESDESEAPRTWLIYDIVRMEYSEEIAHKVASKNKTAL